MNSIGFPFIELQKVDSTNNYATAMAHAGMAQHGAAVFAHEQTSGKGQRNKVWLANKNQNLTISIVVVPQALNLPQFFPLSMAAALGAFSFFKKYAGDETRIKWPNDIYWNDRKAGGILIENIFQGYEWKYSIIGIGLNINQTEFDDLKLKAVSLKQITGANYSIMELAKELCTHLEASFLMLKTDPENIIKKYHQHLYKINEAVRLKKENRNFEAVIKGVTSTGGLVTEHAMEEIFEVGEVEWVI